MPHKDKEARKAYLRAWYARNREKAQQAMARYRAKYPDRRKKADLDYYRATRGESVAERRAHAAAARVIAQIPENRQAKRDEQNAARRAKAFASRPPVLSEEARKQKKAAQKERRRETSRLRYLQNRDEMNKRARAWAVANAEKIKARRLQRREETRVCQREARQRHFAANPHIGPAQCARRRAAKRRAIPTWAERFFIDEAYELACTRSRVTGFIWEVDHLVPLISDRVCGLHVIDNLRVIPQSINRAKGNRTWPNMP